MRHITIKTYKDMKTNFDRLKRKADHLARTKALLDKHNKREIKV